MGRKLVMRNNQVEIIPLEKGTHSSRSMKCPTSIYVRMLLSFGHKIPGDFMVGCKY